ncbi:MAG: hypothetical protein K2L93_08995 [Muribaculaceae bacterium]|nr:hypothetical protein [Muribaculaceae bacterium]
MKTIKLLPLALMALAMTSCLDDDKNVMEVSCYWPEDLTPNLTYVTDPEGESHVYGPSTLSYNFRLEKNEVAVTAVSVPLTETRKVAFVVPTTTYTNTNYGALAMKLPGAVTVNNVNLEAFSAGAVLRNFYGQSKQANYYYADMTVDGYKVSVIQTSNSYYGQTTVNFLTGNPTVYTDLDTSYDMKLDAEKMTATITINNAKFASNMPAQSKITLPDVPVTLSHDGIHFECDELVPLQANGAPKPEFGITDVIGDAKQGRGLQLKFKVAGTWQVDAQCGYIAKSI